MPLLPLDPGDELDPDDRTVLHRSLIASQEDVEAGRLVEAEEVLRDQELDARATAFQEEIGRRLAGGQATLMDFSGVKKRIREELEACKGGHH